jgi:hypothetical protein
MKNGASGIRFLREREFFSAFTGDNSPSGWQTIKLIRISATGKTTAVAFDKQDNRKRIKVKRYQRSFPLSFLIKLKYVIIPDRKKKV